MRPLIAILLLLPLSACALFESPAERALRRSPDFKAGYSDGCSSANAGGANPRDSGLMRDEAAFAANKAYRAGWNSGFGACRSYQGTTAQPDRGVLHTPNPAGPPF